MGVEDTIGAGLCRDSSDFWPHYRPAHIGNGTWHDEVDMSLCFQDTAILYSICFVFWVMAIARFVLPSSRPTLPYSWLNITKLLLCLVLVVTSLCDLVDAVVDKVAHDDHIPNYYYFSAVIMLISLALMIIVILVEKSQGIPSSGIQFLFWAALLVYAGIKLRTLILLSLDEDGISGVFRFVTFIINFTVFLALFVLSMFSERTSAYRFIEEDDNPCPELSASFLSHLTWWWQNGMIINGWRRAVTVGDLWSLNPSDKSGTVAPQLERAWQKRVTKIGTTFHGVPEVNGSGYEPIEIFPAQKTADGASIGPDGRRRKKPSLLIALCLAFGLQFGVAGFLKFIADLLAFVGPQVLKLLIQYTNDEEEPVWKGYFYSALLFFSAVLQSVILQHYFHRCFVVGMHLRTAIISIVYNKALRLSNSARRQSTVGEIVNLMSVDAQRFMDLVTYLHLIWSAPLQIVLSIVFLYIAMGPAVFAGLAVMLLMIPLNAVIASISRTFQVKQMKAKDRRIRLMNEVLNGIKVIKLYAWERHFQSDVIGIRDHELRVLRNAAYLNAVAVFSFTSAPFLVAVATFGTFVATSGEPLTAERAFVALSLFNILRFPLTMLPFLISNLVQASVSLNRLSKFLLYDELNPDNLDSREEAAMGSEDAVSIQNGTFAWERIEQPVLENINLNIKPGQLVAVVGHVGAGKSSLISACLGEMEKMAGHVTVKGRVAYIPQQAWIRNATVRDNILFGKPHNMLLYSRILDCCALGPDLEILPGGDLTEIGEKGINLSGGQKQRVSVARAVYQEADVYYLDDPLSAVDSHVGKHMFDNVIGPQGLLKGKTRVFVTHGLGYLSQCDVIVTIENGVIREVGAYSELIDNDGAFAEFVRTYATMDDEDEEGEAVMSEFTDHEADDLPLTVDELALMSPADDPGSKAKKKVRREFLERQRSKDFDKLATSPPNSESESKSPRRRVRSRTDSTPSSLAERKKKLSRQMSRQLSVQPEPEVQKKSNDPSSQLIQEEKAESGNVKMKVVWEYIKSCTLFIGILVIVFNIALYGCQVYGNIWLAEWSTDEDSPNMTRSTGLYLGVYAALGIGQSIFVFVGSFALALGGIYASSIIHKRILVNVLRLPMSFFDTTPSGRILNRFSKDIYTIDEIIPRSVRSFIMTFFSVISTIFVISYATPLFLVVIVPMIILYLLIQRFYVATSRQLKRLESISRSPIYTHFQETLLGVSSIRAYRHQEQFMLESERKVDLNQVAYYPGICANRWLAIRLEFIGNLIILFASLFAVIARNTTGGLDPGLAGLSITYALQVTQSLNWMVRMTSELEANIVAVERCKEYAEVENEAPAILEDHRPAPGWPGMGRVQFDNYSTRYREGMDLVLREITCNINGGEKVGIVGRTGAGKSSLTLGLFRIIEAVGGSIIIDDHNISLLGLEDLRSRITIIPQDPVLFADTLRHNLDPFDRHSDNELWQCLESAHLKEYIMGLDDKLGHVIAEGGDNLSVGQRQLVCLGRALLRKTKVLVLDEATAAVDLETDDLIQHTIRTEFADCTVITIAHRLNTIMDYDRVLVLEAGRMVEYDAPRNLIEKKGVFYGMVKDAGLV